MVTALISPGAAPKIVGASIVVEATSIPAPSSDAGHTRSSGAGRELVQREPRRQRQPCDESAARRVVADEQQVDREDDSDACEHRRGLREQGRHRLAQPC
jgi:hypothetical protein